MRLPLCAALLLAASPAFAARPVVVEKGSFTFAPSDDQKNVPKRYRLRKRAYTYELEKKRDLKSIGVTVHHLRFPSPYKSETPENNTVHAEYYRPNGDGPYPAVVVLDVTAGNQMYSRHVANHLASQGIAALFVQMAYYGPRRPAESELRLLSPDLFHTTRAITQTVQDLRVAAAWLESRKEIDGKKLGVLGTSLGSFVAALAGEMEPRYGRVCVLLGGGGFVDGYAEHPLAKPYFQFFARLGIKKTLIKPWIAPIDPITSAANLKERKLLIMAASRDDVVPPSMATQLWEASGKQKIVWYDATHYSAAMHLADALGQVIEHFR